MKVGEGQRKQETGCRKGAEKAKDKVPIVQNILFSYIRFQL